VDSQKHRKVEQILYEHNTENIRITIKDEIRENSHGDLKFKPITYRRKEIMLGNRLKVLSAVFIFGYLSQHMLT
jgi:hypothetical protein